jgi:uncharacterized membrane protein
VAAAPRPAGTSTPLMRRLRIAMLIVNVAGIGLASYLTYIHYAGINPLCTLGNSCIKVQTSAWSHLDGVPVALIGLIGYVATFGSLLLPQREETRLATLGMTLIGFGFSGYLTYREIFSIHAICEECVGSLCLIFLLFLGAAIRYVMAPGPPLPDPAEAALPPRRRARVGA